ncbi:MAG: nickel-dependent hydrogenase large subunit, partial [Bryobacteraceae bacterium]|nr:nickel-dependent hydrogenase large subunit [Bryobacteraceae bacterium]
MRIAPDGTLAYSKTLTVPGAVFEWQYYLGDRALVYYVFKEGGADRVQFIALDGSGNLTGNTALNCKLRGSGQIKLTAARRSGTDFAFARLECGLTTGSPEQTLARLNLNFERLPEQARAVASECGFTLPCTNPFKSIIARAIEMVFACHEAIRIISEYEVPEIPCMETAVHAGTGQAATEAPRGLLYHRYVFDDAGQILAAKIIPPTSQNQKRIEDDLWQYLPQLLGKPEEEMTLRCEQAIRNYDPCISCATHFLRLRIDRQGEPCPRS